MSLKKNKAMLFDMDGTLFDTTMVNFTSYQAALKEYGFDLTIEFYWKEFHGNSFNYFLPLVIGENNKDLKAIHTLKKNLYKKNLVHARKNEFLFDIIESSKSNYHIGLVTTASRQNTMDLLSHFEVVNLFELILTNEDVSVPKPSPEGYLKAMKLFTVIPENTLIFEDSDVGITAAELSGARKVKVFDF